MINNKKAMVTEILTSFYSYMLIILIIMAAFFIFSVYPKITNQNMLISYSEDVNVKTVLRNVLRSNIEVNNKVWSYADLILLMHINKRSRTDFDIGIVELLKDFRNNHWQIIITYPKKAAETIEIINFGQKVSYSGYSEAEIKLPSPDGIILVKLFAEKEVQSES